MATVSRREMEFLIRFKADASRALNQVRTQLGGITKQATQANKNMAASSRQANQALQNSANSARKARSAFSGLAIEMRNLNGILATLGVVAFGQSLVHVTREMDRLEAKVKFTFQTTSQFNAVMKDMREESDRLGINFIDMTSQFASFTAASQATGLSTDTLRKIFIGVSEATTALQLPAEQTRGAFFALQQMMAKGKVNSEEFRLQLAERLPIAMTAATRATGLTTAQFQKMLEEGKLISSEFLPKFAAELRKLAAPSLGSAVQSLNAEFNRTRNTFEAFLDAIGSGGFREGLKRLLKAFNDNQMVILELGKALGFLFNVLGTGLSVIFRFTKALADLVGETTVAYGILLLTGGLLAKMLGNVFKLIGGLGKLGGSFKNTAVASALARVSLSGILTAAKGLLKFIPLVGQVLTALTLVFKGGTALGVEFRGEFISVGDIVVFQLKRMVSSLVDFGTKTLPNWVSDSFFAVGEVIKYFESLHPAVEAIFTFIREATFKDFINAIISGGAVIGAALVLGFEHFYEHGKYYLDLLVVEFKKFANSVTESVPEILGGGGKIFDVDDVIPKPESLREKAKLLRMVMDEATSTDYAGDAVKSFAKANAEAVQEIYKERIRLRKEEAEEAARLKKEFSESNIPANSPLSEAELKKRLSTLKKIRKELDDAANDNDLLAILPDSRRVVVEAENNLRKVKDFYTRTKEELKRLGGEFTEADIELEKQRISAKEELLRRAKVEAVKLAKEEAIERLRASTSTLDQLDAALKQMSLEAELRTGEMTDFFKESFDRAKDALAEFVTTGKLDIKSFVDFAAKELAKIAINEITGGFTQSGGGGNSASGFLSTAASVIGSFFHTGGKVGSPTAYKKAVNPALFHNAPRFHSGLRADEFPAILQRGETVVPRNQSPSTFMGGGGGINMPVSVNVTVEGGGAGGDGISNEEQAKRVGSAVADSVRKEVYAIMDKESRPGGRLAGVARGGRT